MVITIDGPVGVGKSTVAKKLAQQIRFRYIDSGAIYRAVALKALRDQIDLNDETELSMMFHEMDLVQTLEEGKLIFFMDGEDITEEIKKPEITGIVSTIASHPAIRFHVTALLHVWGAEGNMVMEGRDTGTYIFPDADYKFYLDADVKIRTERRLKKIQKNGIAGTFDNIEKEISKRDEFETNTDLAPLKIAKDALVIDTSSMTVEQVVDIIAKKIGK